MESQDDPRPPISALPHKRLRVFAKSVRFAALVHGLCRALPAGSGSLRDQLERGSRSVALNIAEGANRLTGREKRRSFVIARAEVGECAAALELCATLGMLPVGKANPAMRDATEIAAMLSALIRRAV